MTAGRLRISRKVGEALYIGPDVCVRVVEARGSNVRLEILAPGSCEVWREELVDAAYLDEFGRRLRANLHNIDVTALRDHGPRFELAAGPITASGSPGGASSIEKNDGEE